MKNEQPAESEKFPLSAVGGSHYRGEDDDLSERECHTLCAVCRSSVARFQGETRSLDLIRASFEVEQFVLSQSLALLTTPRNSAYSFNM